MATDLAAIDDEKVEAKLETDKAKGLTKEDIGRLLNREISAAESNDDAELSTFRTKALEYFDGDIKDLVAEEGRSTVVSKDVSDTIGWMLPGLMQVFMASSNMVIAEPVGDDDDEWARQATLGLNHLFMKDNPGYRILRDATFDALLLKNAIVKVYHDPTPEYAVTYHSGLSDEALADLLEGEDVEVLAYSETTENQPQIDIDPDTDEPMVSLVEVSVHEVKIKRLKSKGRRVIECIPPEDYLQDAEAVFTSKARFRAHRARKTRSDLVEMGFDADIVDTLSISVTDAQEKRAREYVEPGDGTADKSMEEVDLYECYVRCDVDGDGIAETIRAYYAGSKDGGEVLDWEIWEEEGPFFDIPCDPVAHRWDGKSIADETMDIMKNKTALLRQFHDNVYASNNPQRFVKGTITNPEQLFSPTFGGAIFGASDSEVTNLSVPFVAGHALEALAYQDEVGQRRTGVSRQSMALDPEALNNQSATANQNNKDAAYSQIELIARDMAELGWKPVFVALLKLEIKHQDTPRTIRMSGKKAVRIDPKSWNADMDITINVGLGTGSRDRDMRMLGQVLQMQLMMVDRFMGAGAVDDAIDMLPMVLSTLVKMGESAGLRNPADYYPDFTEGKVQKLKQLAADKAKQGDPAIAQIQAKAAAQQAADLQKAQADHQYRMAQLAATSQAEEAAAVRSHQLRMAQINADLDAKRYQTDEEIALKERQLVTEITLRARAGGLGGMESPVSDVQVGGEPG